MVSLDETRRDETRVENFVRACAQREREREREKQRERKEEAADGHRGKAEIREIIGSASRRLFVALVLPSASIFTALIFPARLKVTCHLSRKRGGEGKLTS